MINTNANAYGMRGNVWSPVKQDELTGAAETIVYAHHEVHEGNHYLIRDAVDLAIDSVIDIQWTTHKSIAPHLVWDISVESMMEHYVYEGATIVLAGTTVTPINNNRISTNSSRQTVALITNASLALANADTVVAGATQLSHGVIPAGNKKGGSEGRDAEIILKPNTIYCFRGIALVAGWLSFRMSFYEHA
jgi:hypothetical protein